MRKFVIATMLATIVQIVSAPAPALAAFMGGNELHNDCSHNNIEFCHGYISGVADVMETQNLYGFRACLPESASVGQLADIVKKGFEDNPEERHLLASSLVALYLSEAFPCSE